VNGKVVAASGLCDESGIPVVNVIICFHNVLHCCLLLTSLVV